MEIHKKSYENTKICFFWIFDFLLYLRNTTNICMLYQVLLFLGEQMHKEMKIISWPLHVIFLNEHLLIVSKMWR